MSELNEFVTQNNNRKLLRGFYNSENANMTQCHCDRASKPRMVSHLYSYSVLTMWICIQAYWN